MFKWLFKKGGKKRKLAKQGAEPFDGTTPLPPGASHPNSQPQPTSTSSSPGPSLESLITQTGDVHTSSSSPEVNSVAAQYGSTDDLQLVSSNGSHPVSSTKGDCHPLLSSTTTQPYQPPIQATRTTLSSAPIPTLPQAQDHSSSKPVFQFEGTNMRAIAGGDIGSKNILQQGDGNQIYIQSTGATRADEHEVLLRRIKDKIGAYIASDATLSKEVHGDPSVCYQGTREGLLEHVLSWVEGSPAGTKEDVDDVARRALCIVGAPGSGKSTVMNTLIINLLRDTKRRSPGLIAAHYCIRRSLQSTTDGSKVLPTLILQLARRSLVIAKQISTLLDETLHTDVFAPQLQEEVFLEAISAYNQVVFVIIDALDEASKPASLAATLSRVIPISPPNLRLLLATRNEHGVLQGLGQSLIPKIVHQIPTEESLDEVGAYITCRLRDGLRELFGGDFSWLDWPDESQLRSLSNKAGGLYIWARTTVDFILSRVEKRGLIDRDRLIQDVGRVGVADVSALYMFILKRSLQDDSDEEEVTTAQRVKELLGFITVAEDPLPLDDIVAFLGFKDFDVHNSVRLNRSILVSGTEDIAGSTIPHFHKTFSDFLTSNRAEGFQIELEDAHRSAASRCFELMDSELRFNICRLRSSFKANEEVDELPAPVPKGLIYASTSWWYHLKSAQGESGSQFLLRSYLPFLKTLLHEKFLFWLEIVSLSKKAENSANWLEELASQLEDGKLVAEIDGFSLSDHAKDASLLINMFSRCIDDSIPHIYISLLAFSPEDSIVASHYRNKEITSVIPYSSRMPPRWDLWDTNPRMAHIFTGEEACFISFSPCGRRLAAGYEITGVCVWDVDTGKYGIKPLSPHTSGITPVCFSPNGLLVASGSGDENILVWDAETGRCMLGPLKGHTRQVLSVSFSPDSTRIVSSSADCTIRVWDAFTGDCVLGPLEGHRDEIRSVSYSPDGSCIASGSDDAAIHFWNAQTGGCILGPLVEHEDWIHSLSFHPDGRRLVSSSSDGTLQIWDIQKGICTHEPLTGHNDTVDSVCFSPDGRLIASGSGDQTICIWDAETAVCVAGPFGGASCYISSIAFSPDGKHLAAGSYDGTVRLWDFNALLSAGMRNSAGQTQASTREEITDYTVVKQEGYGEKGGWTLGSQGELLFWAPEPFISAIWRPSTVRILGRPCMIKPDLSNLVTGEEWLSCFRSS